MDGERRLQRLLDTVDDAIDGADEDDLGLRWEVWLSLPLWARDLLLWIVPRWWWALPVPLGRRLLATAAGYIVWQGMPPLAALRRAGARLRLPAPRPVPIPRRLLRPGARPAGPQFRRGGGPPLGRPPLAGRRLARAAVVRRPARVALTRRRAPVRRGGMRRVR